MRTVVQVRAGGGAAPAGLNRRPMLSCTNHTPNLRLLLQCCAPQVSAAAIVEAESLTDDDWEGLAQAARRHGILAVLAERLSRLHVGDAGSSARQRVVMEGRANLLRNQYLTAELASLLAEFERVSIEALVVKGPVLAKLAYGDPGLRAFADLDLLIRPASLRAAASLLIRLGFVPDLYDLAAAESGFFDAVESNFQRAAGIVNIDLHWGLSPASYPFGPGGDDVWRRATDVKLEGKGVKTLAPEDHLLFIAVHASRHGWETLSYACDIAYFVSRVALDWPLLLERAAVTRCRGMLVVGLRLAAELFGVAMPPVAIAAEGAEPRIAALAATIAAELRADTSPGASTLFRRSIGSISSFRDRSRCILMRGLVPTLVDRRYRPMPRTLYPTYYLLRPLRLGRSMIGRSVLRRCKR